MANKRVAMDGNTAAAFVAHKTNEVIAIYPITPSSVMGELSDIWSARGDKNIWARYLPSWRCSRKAARPGSSISATEA